MGCNGTIQQDDAPGRSPARRVHRPVRKRKAHVRRLPSRTALHARQRLPALLISAWWRATKRSAYIVTLRTASRPWMTRWLTTSTSQFSRRVWRPTLASQEPAMSNQSSAGRTSAGRTSVSKGSMWIQFPQASRKVVVSARVPTRIFYIRWNRGRLGPWARLIEVQRGRGLTHDRAICGWEDSNSQKHHSMRRQFRRSESINAARKRAERGVRFPTDDGPLARSKYRRPRREQES